MWATARLGLTALADGVAVVALHPHRTLLQHLAAPHAWVAAVGPDGAAAELATAALWLAAVWLAVGLLCALAASLPGAVGRAGGAVARVVLPRAVYRLVAGAGGLGLLLTSVAAAADEPRAVSTAPAWPTSNPLAPPAWPLPPLSTPDRPRRDRPAPDRPARADQVVVERGDSLWTIAADHLRGHRTPRRIAAAWPRWYAANRPVVGADPNQLVPGQVLSAPDAEEGT